MKNRSTAIAYAGIISVVLIWGLIPSAKKALIGDSFSASVYSAITAFAAACVLLAMSAKHLKSLNRDYFKIAVPTGTCVGLAALVQALAYNFNASPTNQAFLENLSCVIVPVLLFVIIKNKNSSSRFLVIIITYKSTYINKECHFLIIFLKIYE